MYGAHTAVDTQLPPGWEKKVAPDGRAYYIDHNTQQTSWDPPAPPPPYGGAGPPAYAAAPAPQQHPGAVLPMATVMAAPAMAAPAMAAAPVGVGQQIFHAQPVEASWAAPTAVAAPRAPLPRAALTAEKRAAAQQAFSLYDADRSGAIDSNEFYQVRGVCIVKGFTRRVHSCHLGGCTELQD